MLRSRVGVVGGGLAGITAALACADAGAVVTLFEARPTLGGLTTSFRRGDLMVDNGQHVFLRCCTSYLRLLRRLGVRDRVTLQPRLDIPVREPHTERPYRLRRSGLPAPLHLAPALLRYGALPPLDRLRAARAALALRRLDPHDRRLDAESFGAWLHRHGQDREAVAALWDLFVVATLNAPSDRASLAAAVQVFQTGLLHSPDAADIGWSRVPLLDLHGVAARHALVAAGAEVRTHAKVDQLQESAGRWILRERRGETFELDAVVLAAPPTVTERLCPPQLLDVAPGWSVRLGTSPIVNVHVVLDHKVVREPFIAGVRTPVQWVFDRTEQSGLESGQYLAVSLSAADDWVDRPTAVLGAEILPALQDLLPGMGATNVVDFFVTRERAATFRPAPGTAVDRPAPRTRSPRLALAGAWTDTGWPATMEGAVRSGEAAAAALLPTTAVRGPVAV